MSSNENNRFVNHHETNLTATTIQTLLSSSVNNFNAVAVNSSSNKRTLNLAVLIGCLSLGLIFIILIIYALIKYRNRDEGSYKIDESQNFLNKNYLDHQDQAANKGFLAPSHRQKLVASHTQNGLDSKEWYV